MDVVLPSDPDRVKRSHPSRLQGKAAILTAVIMFLGLVLPDGWPPALQRRLHEAFGLEMVVVFTSIIPLALGANSHRRTRTSDKVLYWGYGTMYLTVLGLVAWHSARGITVAIEMAVLIGVTYGGMLVRPPNLTVAVSYILRSLFCLATLFAIAILIGGIYKGLFAGNEKDGLLLGSGIYFATLGTLDLYNVFFGWAKSLMKMHVGK